MRFCFLKCLQHYNRELEVLMHNHYWQFFKSKPRTQNIFFLIIGLKSSTKLWNHMYKYHIKTKEDFFCSLCNNKAFKQAFNFQLHMLIHLEEQPEKCRFCSKAFRTKPSLRKHELIHTGLKLFPCPLCNSRFKTKDELKQHKISHTTGMNKIP